MDEFTPKSDPYHTNLTTDIQNRLSQGFRPEVHYSRDRERRRTAVAIQKRLDLRDHDAEVELTIT
jgi:ribulose bisphosphate carboxylase small subunit